MSSRRRRTDIDVAAPSSRPGNIPSMGNPGSMPSMRRQEIDASNMDFNRRKRDSDFDMDIDGDSRRRDNDMDGDSRRRDNDMDLDTDGKPKKSSARKKALDFCKKNPKTCVGAVAGAGFAAYVGKKYKDLKEEEKVCLEQCYPSDWADYIEGTVSEPKYKTRLDFSEIEDEEVLEGIEENLCNPENLELNDIKKDKKSCDTFCEASCEATLARALGESVRDVGDLAGSGANLGANMAKDFLASFLEGLGIDLEQLKSYGKMALIGIVVICILSVLMKFM